MIDYLKEHVFQYLPFVLFTADGKRIKLNLGRILEMLIIGVVAAYFISVQLKTKVDHLEQRIERIEKSVQRVEDRLFETIQ
ncbi:MAG: hypothetical protein DDT22_00257 [candidate division WS2 bacterium]|nr:hypothetical protein [Candidatus Lithacetigena glycinireducens]MBT9174597.1 hypothetical protein [Candidatus Lithacetigena glycinireducens]